MQSLAASLELARIVFDAQSDERTRQAFANTRTAYEVFQEYQETCDITGACFLLSDSWVILQEDLAQCALCRLWERLHNWTKRNWRKLPDNRPAATIRLEKQLDRYGRKLEYPRNWGQPKSDVPTPSWWPAYLALLHDLDAPMLAALAIKRADGRRLTDADLADLLSTTRYQVRKRMAETLDRLATL